jgi:hypothetical protein
MIYPKGLSKNSSCMSEFIHQRSPVRYRLPLRSCNTMSTDLVSSLAALSQAAFNTVWLISKLKVHVAVTLIFIHVSSVGLSTHTHTHTHKRLSP